MFPYQEALIEMTNAPYHFNAVTCGKAILKVHPILSF
jgi:hypothetical protein